MNYRIVMDSSSNIRTMENVAFTAVPLKIITEQREFADDNTLELDRMLDYLETYKGRSGTSCPSVGDWLDAFGDADWIFALAITSSLSGSYNALVQAKAVYEQTHPERRVCALDTLSTGPEMVLIAMKIRELLRRGERFDRVETETRAYMNRTRLIFCLESMNNLARNGRVSPLVAKLAGVLGIRVVGKASCQGTLQPLHKSRGESKTLGLIVREMKNEGYTGGAVRIDHCCNEATAQKLRALLEEEFPGCAPQIGSCTGLCSFYAERGGLLIGFETGDA